MDGEFTKLLPRCGVDESSCLTKWWRCALFFFYHWRTWVVVVLLLTVEAFRREPELPTPDYSEGLPRLLIQPEEGSRPEGSLYFPSKDVAWSAEFIWHFVFCSDYLAGVLERKQNAVNASGLSCDVLKIWVISFFVKFGRAYTAFSAFIHIPTSVIICFSDSWTIFLTFFCLKLKWWSCKHKSQLLGSKNISRQRWQHSTDQAVLLKGDVKLYRLIYFHLFHFCFCS